MARTDTLPHFLTDVADSIRDRTGSQELISASEFDSEINSIIKSTDVFNTDFTTNQYTPGSTLTKADYVVRCPLFLIIKKLPKLSLDFTSFTSIAYALSNVKLESIDVSEWDVSTIINFHDAFSNTNLSVLDLHNWQPPISVDAFTNTIAGLLDNCSSLVRADLSCFNGSWNIGRALNGCTSLEHLDIRGLDLTNCASQSTFLGDTSSSPTALVPYDCEIIVADQTQKTYMTTNFPDYINVKTVSEFEVI